MQKLHISLDDRLFLPAGTGAILWDLDGTLVDSFQLDLDVCARILSAQAGRPIEIPVPVLREGFALSGSDFWAFLFKSLGIDASPEALEAAHAEWLLQRLVTAFPVNEGIRAILDAARAAGLRQAVVSNNPQAELERILFNSGLGNCFDAVAGNDGSGRAKKPAPDSYLFAAKSLGVDPARCAAVEDSVLGLKAARASGAYVVGVASGAELFDTLRASGLADVCYTLFTHCRVEPAGDAAAEVRTPCAEVSAVLRGLLAHTGPFRIEWSNDDWALLGTLIADAL